MFFMFKGNKPSGSKIIHINGKNKDNRLKNLKLLEVCKIVDGIIVEILLFNDEIPKDCLFKIRSDDDYLGKKI